MKVAIMQPYIFPYIGYFQLINAVDQFVVYDNIQYTKKGWINRNRILVNGKDEYFTIPLKKGSDFLDVDQRYLADTIEMEKKKLLNKLQASYRKAPYFNEVYALLQTTFNEPETNLFQFLKTSLVSVCEFLEIKTPIIVSSTVTIDHSLKSEDKVLAICKAVGATGYINPIGGVELYSKDRFRENNIELAFIQSAPAEYRQFGDTFVPWLSIIDVLMFNSKEQVREMLELFTLK